jgi:hypothetical protein
VTAREAALLDRVDKQLVAAIALLRTMTPDELAELSDALAGVVASEAVAPRLRQASAFVLTAVDAVTDGDCPDPLNLLAAGKALNRYSGEHADDDF